MRILSAVITGVAGEERAVTLEMGIDVMTVSVDGSQVLFKTLGKEWTIVEGNSTATIADAFVGVYQAFEKTARRMSQ